MVGLWCSGYCDGWTAVVRVLRWLGCGGEGTTMVRMWCSRYYDGCVGGLDITMIGLWCSGYCDSWAAVVRVLR